MDKLTGDELSFYMDQKGPRIGRISESIDVEYEEEILAEHERTIAIAERNQLEHDHAWGEFEMEVCEFPSDMDTGSGKESLQLDVSVHRSGYVRSNQCGVDFSQQFDMDVPKPRIRINRNCSERIKATCAKVSVQCNISTKMSRECVKVVCEELYNHRFYLSKEEAISSDPTLSHMKESLEVSNEIKPSKRIKHAEQAPHVLEDWKLYENVLPSAKVINNHKHNLAIQHEKNAANYLFNIKDGVKVTLHYDSTSRSKIDGEWPSLILTFTDGT